MAHFIVHARKNLRLRNNVADALVEFRGNSEKGSFTEWHALFALDHTAASTTWQAPPPASRFSTTTGKIAALLRALCFIG